MASLIARSFAFASLVALMATLSGCDFFRPADPELPPPGVPLIADYSSHEATLETLRLGIEAKNSLGASVYIGGFADSTSPSAPAFHQFFSRQDEDIYEATSGQQAPDWDYRKELSFYGDFINYRPDPYVMTWAPDLEHDVFDDIQSDFARIHRHYLVTANPESKPLVIAVGYADITMRKNAQGLWLITIWDDRRDEFANPDDTEQQTLGARRLNL